MLLRRFALLRQLVMTITLLLSSMLGPPQLAAQAAGAGVGDAPGGVGDALGGV